MFREVQLFVIREIMPKFGCLFLWDGKILVSNRPFEILTLDILLIIIAIKYLFLTFTKSKSEKKSICWFELFIFALVSQNGVKSQLSSRRKIPVENVVSLTIL